jgi:pentose-5-phosphate-3-epimerase
MIVSHIHTFSFIIFFHFHLMVCNSNSIIEDAVIPFKHSTTNNLLISIHKENFDCTESVTTRITY